MACLRGGPGGRWRGAVDSLRQARRHGHLTTVASVPALARTVLATMRGIEALGKAGASRRVLRDVANTTIALLSASDPALTAPTGQKGAAARR